MSSNSPIGIPTIQPIIPQAICPRCGKAYKTDKPIEYCKECGLKVGKKNKDGSIDWNKTMKEPFPEFINSANPVEIFCKTIQWHYKKWMKPHKGNPSYNLP